MKVIFLDIDGVLNYETYNISFNHMIGLDDKLISRLARIVNTTSAKIVLVSTWKYDWSPNREDCTASGLYLTDMLSAHGLTIIDKTAEREDDYILARDEDYVNHMHYYGRGEGILHYLDGHEVETFVILDDGQDDYDSCELTDYWVRTSYKTGLTDADVKKAIEILNRKVQNELRNLGY